MTTTLSSQLEVPTPQPPTHVQSSRPYLLSTRPLLESYYGESEETPTPQPKKKSRFDSTPKISPSRSSTALHTTPQLAQVPDDFSMEESGDESDEVYDQFDLGDFTKEEIKAYESMVGPGERLRDAAPPEKYLAEILEDSCETFKVFLVLSTYC